MITHEYTVEITDITNHGLSEEDTNKIKSAIEERLPIGYYVNVQKTRPKPFPDDDDDEPDVPDRPWPDIDPDEEKRRK